jgi:hypothetical protein
MSATTVLDQVCRYFGGEYDPDARAYLDPQVPGLGSVRRARGKRTNHNELHGGMATETHGTAMLVHIASGEESRAAMAGAFSGLKLVRFEVILHVFLHSAAAYAEDGQDAFFALRDALFDHFHADRTLGSGGFENPGPPPGFQCGEGSGPPLRWEMDPVETSATVTRGYLSIGFAADQYIQA